METASRSNKSFMDDDDDDDDDFGKETSSRKEVAVKVDSDRHRNNDNSCTDQKPSTPRSKHSATEQRRRSRINDRFRILRDLIPDSDQKRDKASFLLEVIEYIQILQEKVLKYELNYPIYNPNNAKLVPWKNSQGPGDPSLRRNTPASTGFMFPSDGAMSDSQLAISSSQDVAESVNLSSALAGKLAVPPIPIQYPPATNREGLGKSSGASGAETVHHGNSIDTDALSGGQEELVIDEGTINLSCEYSDRFLAALAQALRNSGIDLSEASISVQINLADLEDQAAGHQSRSRDCVEDPGFGCKRPKSDAV
ncbi:unnamed protein product [Spirodela intermedia]|uniref:BHLH domain-containing protein n=1 Tax=Spirodela intermedia TaxID=51605 RepID=A0A7I8JRU6_SPIIN|nr:unnamed protein product [Spirodela intermedia]CAA6672465.1 unnamed protein product [Spirodela intermedia]